MRRVFCVLFICSTVNIYAGQVVSESARRIPVAYDVDVLVVGGSSGAVAAAAGPNLDALAVNK